MFIEATFDCSSFSMRQNASSTRHEAREILTWISSSPNRLDSNLLFFFPVLRQPFYYVVFPSPAQLSAARYHFFPWPLFSLQISCRPPIALFELYWFLFTFFFQSDSCTVYHGRQYKSDALFFRDVFHSRLHTRIQFLEI